MYPVLFSFGSFDVYSYGVMAAAAVGFAYLFSAARAERYGVPRSAAGDLIFILFVSGVIGARLLYVVQNWEVYADRWLTAFFLREGGLVWYGGFMAAAAAGLVYARTRNLPPLKLCDLAVPALAFAHAIGRVGCFLNGCCYGIRAEAGLFERVPVQLYEAGGLVLIGWALVGFARSARRDGSVFAAYLALYGALRFAVEFYRDGQDKFLSLTVPQWTSLFAMLAAAAFWVFTRRPHGKA